MSDQSGKLGRVLLIIGRLLLAAIFIVAAYAKLKPVSGMTWSAASVRTSLAMFAMQVDSYQMLSPGTVNFVAHALPFAELVLGLWLLAGVALRASSLVASLAILGFIAAMTSAYVRGLTISCGCFGPGEQIGPRSLIRDGLLFLPLAIAVAIGAFLSARRHSATMSVAQGNET